jgi:PII-like signaling protein
MRIEGPAKWVRIYIGESDRWEGKPLYQAIVERMRRDGIAGATVVRAVEGFGAHSRIHTARVLRMSEDLPLIVDVIDRAERIEAVLPALDDMVREGLVVVLDVNVVTYRSRADGRDRNARR